MITSSPIVKYMYYKRFKILAMYIDNFSEKQKSFYYFYKCGRWTNSIILLWIKENAVSIDIYFIKHVISYLRMALSF